MTIDDIFFAVGIIIVSSLLVFVMYDDVTTIQYRISLEDMDLNISDTANLSKNDTLVPVVINNSIVDLKPKTTDSIYSNSSLFTKKANTGTSSVQSSTSAKSSTNVKSSTQVQSSNPIKSSTSQKSNVNTNIKTSTGNVKTPNDYNMHSNQEMRQNEPSRQSNNMR